MPFTPAALGDALADAFPGQIPGHWCVALSGGLDSTVLLHALAAVLAADPGRSLRAVHVHHGIYPDADRWTELAAAQARAAGCPFQALRVSVPRSAGESLEAQARLARYRALGEVLKAGEVLFTAHHQDDQMETVLLQLMRGAGPAGLAAMPVLARFAGGWHCRPLLGVPRRELARWAREQALQWVEEPSNQDIRFDRNYLRHEVIPRLRERWPAAARAVSRSARHCAEAQDLLQDLAGHDMERAGGPGALSVEHLLAMGAARRNNLLRYWICLSELPPAPAHVLERVEAQVLRAGASALPCLGWSGGEMRRYRGRLYAMERLGAAPAAAISLAPGQTLELPAGLGRIGLAQAGSGGIDPAALRDAKLEIRFRSGGERLAMQRRGGHHSLRKLMQEQGVLPWMRDRLPLLFVGGRLAAVAELWIDDAFLNRGPGPGLTLSWSGHPALKG